MTQLKHRLAELLLQRQAARSLARPFYADPEIFAYEIEHFVMRHWLCAGHESRVPEPGDYFLTAIASESVIIVRDKDRKLHAFANVCRHRGSKICREQSGNAAAFMCPYHAWTYNLDGALRAARDMPEGFDRTVHALKEFQLQVCEGLIFFSFSHAPLGFADAQSNLRSVCVPYGWSSANVAHRQTYSFAANWKLAVENYVECYHCAPSHPEFSRIHSNEHSEGTVTELRQQLQRKTAALGLAIPCMDRWALRASPVQEATWSARYALTGDAVSGSDDGKPVAPLMGLFKDYDGGATFFHVGNLNFFLAYPDYGVIYRFIPRDLQSTEMEVCWLVRNDAAEGVDFNLDRLTWMWRVTSEADKRIIEDNQAGVNSRYYSPGTLSRMESVVGRFTDWYAHEMAVSQES